MNKRAVVLLSTVISIVVFLAAILVGGLVLWTGPGGQGEKTVFILPKSGSRTIAKALKQAKVVRSAHVFRYYTILTGQARKLKAGEYVFQPRATLQQVTAKLANGEVVDHAVTIPEGFTAGQIAERLEQEKLVSAQAFLAVCHDKELARQWNIPGAGLEGFLFPDTYKLTRGMTAKQIAKHMVDRFKEEINQALLTAGKAQGLDQLKLITLASIIEREVKAKSEQPIVASIFYNRLAKRKRLESCATVLYAQGRTHGSLSLEDLETKSPYNTYRHRGLPPGPIGNPGLSAIHAAAFPAKTEYMFFVVRPDGTHVFSKTFEEHKRAKWRQKKARHRTVSPAGDKQKP